LAFASLNVNAKKSALPLNILKRQNGYKNDIKLQGLISGTFNTFWALGLALFFLFIY
jgi:hypothetical protein